MIDKIKVKKGLDLRLKGIVAPDAVPVDLEPTLVAVCPDDFRGFVPKPEVREGDTVEAFQPLLRDKDDERVKLVSPVAGTVKAVVRGARRKIERVVVEAAPGPERTFSGDFAGALMASGLWAMMRQRPYDIVPRTGVRPRDIFVTAFDSSPLAAAPAPTADDVRLMEAGVEALRGLTDGEVYVSRRPGALPDLKGALMVDVEGPHPAGNAGTQIAAIAPVNKGETVWTLSANVLREAGRLASEGRVDSHVTVAVTGPEAREPRLVRTVAGAAVAPLLEGEMRDGAAHIRVVSGNVLCGVAVGEDGFLRYPYRQLTLMREGDDVDEFMGWASLSPSKMSLSRTFPGALWRRRRYSPDARVLGGRRAMIMSGVYESLFPMDILPEYLVKAMIAKDVEQMEALGAYEVAPEDFALAEYADPSKIELQRIVAESLDFLRKNA